MDVKQQLLKQIQSGTFALWTDEQISRALKLGRRESYALRGMLLSLCRSGELLTDSRSRFGTAEQFGAMTGKFTGNERGFGFFTPDDGSPDLFIPRRAVKDALHGDVVLAIPVKGRSEDEGEILAVIERGYREIVGVYHRESHAGYLRPDEKKYTRDILIPAGKNRGCPDGSKAVARLTSQDGEPAGEIVEILGKQGDFFTEELSLIRAHSLREEFPKEVEDEAYRIADVPLSPADFRGRLDLRNELIITVDGEDTRDIDDAISVRRKGDVYLLGVHIADVSNYVAAGGVLDREAFRRGTSVYFPDRVLPMLPRALSNGICSLNEGEDRLTLSCLMKIDQRGNVLSKEIAPSVIRSRHRMTYTDVTAIAEGRPSARKTYPDLTETVQIAVELTELLKRKREARGGIDLEIKEAKILFENGKIVIPEHKRTISHEMIEQFMVLANESVAELMTEKKVPFVYRVHEAPSEEKAKGFAAFLAESGLKVGFDPLKVVPTDYKRILDGLKENPLFPIVNRVMLRSMMKAVYSPENIGHFGLASDCYCHFTSPIRRYPDLCIHRIIKEALRSPAAAKEKYKTFVSEAAKQSSACERNAVEAERDVDALYIVEYMQDKIGEIYEATVSGVTSFGLFAELSNTIEGFLPIETLPDDYYSFEEEKFLLKGTKISFRLGEKIRVKVAGVDRGARRVQFLFLEKTI